MTSPPNQNPRGGTGRLLGNILSLTGGKVLADLVTLILIVVISRVYGSEAFGQYSLATAIAGFFYVGAEFGLTPMSMKVLSRTAVNFGQEYSRLFTARLFSSALTMLVLVIYVVLFTDLDDFGFVLLALCSSSILYIVGDGFVASLLAQQMMHLAAVLEFLLRLTTTAAVCAAVLVGASFHEALVAFPIANLLFIVAAGMLASRYSGAPRLRWKLRETIATLRSATPYGATEFLTHFASRIDVLAVGAILGTAAAGLYNAGFRVIFALNFIPTFSAKTLLPVLSSRHEEDLGVRALSFSRYLGTALLLALPASVGLYLIAPRLIPMLFGAEFVDSARVLQVLAALVSLNTCSRFLIMYLAATDRQPIVARLQVKILVVNVASNLVLIPLLGIAGAAVATITWQVIYVSFLFRSVLSEIDVQHIARRFGAAACGVIVMAGVFTFFGAWNLFVLMILSAVTYLGVISSFPSIRATELKQVSSTVRSLITRIA